MLSLLQLDFVTMGVIPYSVDVEPIICCGIILLLVFDEKDVEESSQLKQESL